MVQGALGFPRVLCPATFLQRLSRFSAMVERDGTAEKVYVPNSGRMKELLVPGAEVWLAGGNAPHRVTAFDLALARFNGFLVSIDSRIPNELIHRALLDGMLPELPMAQEVRREVRFGESRLDFGMDCSGTPWLIETKSVTLVRDGVARFPDAPTPRGARHLRELIASLQQGYRAAAIFVVQRPDATSLSPNDETDPDFGAALRHAIAAGVLALAYRCEVSLEGIRIVSSIPVVTD